MKKIILLTDYKGYIGSNKREKIYRSGFRKVELEKNFRKHDFECTFYTFTDFINRGIDLTNHYILYTSSEDIGYHYKEYIEDVVSALEESGAKLVPEYKYLKANNNKVYMELLRNQYGKHWNDSLKTWICGTCEEASKYTNDINFPIVIKKSAGAMSRGVFLAENKADLHKKLKKISRTKHIFQDIKDALRPFKHKGYVRESLYRKKFVLQQYIPNLQNDWKILIFGDKYFILSRPVRKGDFRASGSGHKNYFYGSKCEYPSGIFDYAEKIFNTLNVPHLSLDIVYDGNEFFLVEFQAIYFGTIGLVNSDIYFTNTNSLWTSKQNDISLEQVYVESIIWFLKKHESSICK